MTVQLTPLDGSPWGVGGKTNLNGVVTFKTHGKFSGVPAGKYRIATTKEEMERFDDGVNIISRYYTLIDPDHLAQNKELFEIEVVAGKNNFEPFDLGKKVRVLLKP